MTQLKERICLLFIESRQGEMTQTIDQYNNLARKNLFIENSNKRVSLILRQKVPLLKIRFNN